MDLTETVSVWELAWTILAGIGLVLHLALVIDALRDKFALNEKIKLGHARKDGPRYTLANLNIVEDLSRAALQLGLLLIGLIAMGNPPNPVTSGAPSGIILLVVELILIAVSVYSLRSRYRVVSQMRSYIFQAGLPSLAPGEGNVSYQDGVTTTSVRDKEEPPIE